MKISIITLSIAILLLSACLGNQKKVHDHSDGTHQHDEGSIHQNHEADTVKQEEFTTLADTSMSRTALEKEQTHEGHEHPHNH
jgi:hypothetical protein